MADEFDLSSLDGFDASAGPSFDFSGADMPWSNVDQSSAIDPSAFNVSQDFSGLQLPSMPGVQGGGSAGSALGGLAGLLSSPLTRGLLGLGSGIVGIGQGKDLQGLAQTAFNQSNPFGPYRQQYANQLGTLMANPSSIFSDPGYQAAQKQGLQGVERTMAAQGFLGSGNEAIALQQYGTGFANQYLQQQESNLANLAGAGITPNFGAALGGFGQGSQTIGGGLASLGAGLNIFGGTNSGASAGTPAGGGGFSGAGGQAAIGTGLGLAKSGVGLANYATGGSNAGVSGLNQGLGLATDALGIYSGLQKGGVAGYGMAAADTAKLISSGASALGAENLTTEAIGGLASYIAAPLAVYNAVDNWKPGATGKDALGGAEAGAAIGSVVPVIGTAVGAIVGGLVGAASSAFGSKDANKEKWQGWASGGAQQDPSKIDPTQLLDVVGGLFRSGDPGFSGVSDFGGKGGNGNQFTAALGNEIAGAISSGKISATTPYQQVYQQVVQPWIQGLPGGWKTNAEAGYGEQQLMQALTYNYMNGRPITWGEAQGGKATIPYTPIGAFAGGAKPQVTQTPLMNQGGVGGGAPSNLALTAMSGPQRMQIPQLPQLARAA